MAYTLINGAAINADSQEDEGSTKGIPMVLTSRVSAAAANLAPGRNALGIGVPNVASGTDTQLLPWGIGMVRAGMHEALIAQPPASGMAVAQGKRAVRFGMGAVSTSIAVRAGGASALSLGQPSGVKVARAGGFSAMTVGGASSQAVARASGREAMALGALSAGLALPVLQGIALVASGRAVALQGAVEGQAADGTVALGFGIPGPLVQVAYARQSLALELGRPTVARTYQC